MQSPHPLVRPKSVALILLILTMVIMAGAWMKILHYPGSDMVLAIGLIGQAGALVSLAYLSLKKKL